MAKSTNTNNTNKKKGMSGGEMAAVGAGVAALGAGAYYLLGPKGKKHQQKAKSLLNKMKKDVANEIKKASDVTTPLYHKAVDVISDNYARQYSMFDREIKALAEKLKGSWAGEKKPSRRSGSRPKKTSTTKTKRKGGNKNSQKGA